MFYACALPIWEGFDEYAHYARIEYLATEGHEPLRTTPVPADIAETFSHAPLHNGGMATDQYWKLSADERRRGFPVPGQTIYEAQQPPLFYWLMAPLYRSMRGISLAGELMAMRAVCVLLASLLIPLGFLIARRLCGGDLPAIGATALMAALPVMTFTATHVGNEALAIPLGALVLYLTLRGRPVILAAVLGAALLTKAYFLLFLPPIAFTMLFRKTRRSALIALAGAIAMGGWWYWLTWRESGSLTGNIILAGSPGVQLWRLIPTVPWFQAFDFASKTFVWIGNWSFIVLRTWMYRVVDMVALFASCGVAYRIWKREPGIALCGAFVAVFTAGIAYFGLVSFATSGFPGAIAWYACCLSAPIAVLAFVGLRTVTPLKIRSAAGPFLVVLLAAFEMFGVNFLMLPYYGGIISHRPNGALPACRLDQVMTGSRLMMERLTLYKPVWLTASVLLGLWMLYLTATLALVAISIHMAVRETGKWKRLFNRS